MNYKLGIACAICLLIVFPFPASSASSNLKIDVYYNDQLYPGASTPKPLLKVGEPFTLKFEVTCYKRNELSVKLWSIGNNDFDILEGPTSKLGSYTDTIIEENETWVAEWTVVPNEEWAGGSAPINFYYQMMDLERRKMITSGEFTAAYVTISEEYYDSPETPSASTTQASNENNVQTTPAFTAFYVVFALASLVILKRK